ncbi:MAG: GcrA family cell cycle regulator [Hyphomicrobiales bacterium]|nr:GcrA family cell cycle regulator [Hyphomicrobiales bacterium]
MCWTAERVEQLKSAWTTGLSAAQIAAQLGDVSRNAVIGKLHRLGLKRAHLTRTHRSVSPRQRPPHRLLPQSPFVPARVCEPRLRLPSHLPELAPPPERVRLLILSATRCRSPEGDPKRVDFHFCGRSARPRCPYCPHHAARAIHAR